jgi:hypothetical protein
MAIIALAYARPAFACQPPRDMPSDPAAQSAYWQRARSNWEKHLATTTPTLLVARVSRKAANPDMPVQAFDAEVNVAFAPIKVLRGQFDQRGTGVYSNHWCDDFKVSVSDQGHYLLALSGQRILLAIPLEKGQEKAGVGAFFARIGEPDLWQ